MSDQNRPSLTYPAVIAGAVATATATVLSTRLGLVGTVIGAVVASMVSTLVSTVCVRWLERAHSRLTATRDAGPPAWQRVAVGAVALCLVGVALHTGLDLLTSDLPREAFASRFLAQLGLEPVGG